MESFEAKKIDVTLVPHAVTRHNFKRPRSRTFFAHVVPAEFTEAPVVRLFELFTTVQTLIRWLLLFDGLEEFEYHVLHTELIPPTVSLELSRNNLLDVVFKHIGLAALDLVR